MGKYTRYSGLLVNVMSKELRDEFFTECETDFDAGWDLFESLYPEKAEALMEILSPMLETIISDLAFRRDYDKLLGAGDEIAAARLKICHRANKIEW